MNILTANTRAIDTMNLIAKLKLIRLLALIAFCAMPMLATGAEQKTFATPDEGSMRCSRHSRPMTMQRWSRSSATSTRA